MARLHIFNPDTEYALAAGDVHFTPPSQVMGLRRSHALLPAIYASAGDAILLLDPPESDTTQLPGYDLVEEKQLRIFTLEDVRRHPEWLRRYTPEPWGWNQSIRRWLFSRIGDMPGLPSEEAMTRLRELSHRRTTIAMLSAMKGFVDDEIVLPQEIPDVKTAMAAYHSDPRRYFKEPWSSSGRGILLTDDLEEKHVEPWLRGVINRQGSVMMEKAYKRKLDFATEWMCNGGEARFLGYSVFQTSRRGKYHGNLRAPQPELLAQIRTHTDEWNDEYLNCQKRALEQVVAKDYDGPAGIDMLVTENGHVNPCVEINLRHTMGMFFNDKC